MLRLFSFKSFRVCGVCFSHLEMSTFERKALELDQVDDAQQQQQQQQQHHARHRFNLYGNELQMCYHTTLLTYYE